MLDYNEHTVGMPDDLAAVLDVPGRNVTDVVILYIQIQSTELARERQFDSA